MKMRTHTFILPFPHKVHQHDPGASKASVYTLQLVNEREKNRENSLQTVTNGRSRHQHWCFSWQSCCYTHTRKLPLSKQLKTTKILPTSFYGLGVRAQAVQGLWVSSEGSAGRGSTALSMGLSAGSLFFLLAAGLSLRQRNNK